MSEPTIHTDESGLPYLVCPCCTGKGCQKVRPKEHALSIRLICDACKGLGRLPVPRWYLDATESMRTVTGAAKAALKRVSSKTNRPG